jgi:two-component system sensor histidine kinase AtoS
MGQEGKLSVVTNISKDDTGRPMLQISIVDTGPGIPDEIRESMFDPFVKGKDQGVGLGLSISQRITEQHHGWISAMNNTGRGATFTIHLPLNE